MAFPKQNNRYMVLFVIMKIFDLYIYIHEYMYIFIFIYYTRISFTVCTWNLFVLFFPQQNPPK